MPNSSSPNRPTVAVIGCGYWGKNLVRNFAQLGALSLVCDKAEEGLRKAEEMANNCPKIGNLEAVWESPVEGVVIATPAETHYDLSKRALLAGKDVLCEKPLAMTYEQGAELVQIAERNERILMVGHVLEYHPGIVRLLELVRAGELGKVKYIYSNRLSLGVGDTESGPNSDILGQAGVGMRMEHCLDFPVKGRAESVR
jgi:predicted dehydrogenase